MPLLSSRAKARDLGFALAVFPSEREGSRSAFACHPEERSDSVASPEGAKDLGVGFGVFPSESEGSRFALACHPEERSDRVASPEGAKDLGVGFGVFPSEREGSVFEVSLLSRPSESKARYLGHGTGLGMTLNRCRPEQSEGSGFEAIRNKSRSLVASLARDDKARLSSRANARDLGFGSDHNQKRDPSGGETYPQDDKNRSSRCSGRLQYPE